MLNRIASCLLLISVLASCQKELKMDATAIHNIELRFKPVVLFDTVEMKFDTVTYKNAFNESFKVSAFKFYVHAFELFNTDSNRISRAGDQDYYLVDFADSNSTVIKLNVVPYKYNVLAFTMGVDSVLNVSGAQTGVLDPAKGMFWEWNTGYIMSKLEGTSPVSTAPANSFKYHIGGFRQAESVIKKITLLFPYPEVIDMKPGKKTVIDITADVYDWFNNPHDIRIGTNAGVMSPGTLAQQIAENYSKMFAVVKVKND
ncbi:MbnP family protein [Paraflavitalea sp. CAU 1676]|uniref:MbnP family protein n=1 Tax=Paraflavitalea sp. CAU 1676 TaxID=3032598 RepID=UPI0023DC8859|nr:MbnP family protein [Paraflavitalea sp. CAU 1676]MDF2187277.1 hypothetical protein [Paraflavitalea sp. CAU 1676]